MSPLEVLESRLEKHHKKALNGLLAQIQITFGQEENSEGNLFTGVSRPEIYTLCLNYLVNKELNKSALYHSIQALGTALELTDETNSTVTAFVKMKIIDACVLYATKTEKSSSKKKSFSEQNIIRLLKFRSLANVESASTALNDVCSELNISLNDKIRIQTQFEHFLKSSQESKHNFLLGTIIASAIYSLKICESGGKPITQERIMTAIEIALGYSITKQAITGFFTQMNLPSSTTKKRTIDEISSSNNPEAEPSTKKPQTEQGILGANIANTSYSELSLRMWNDETTSKENPKTTEQFIVESNNAGLSQEQNRSNAIRTANFSCD